MNSQDRRSGESIEAYYARLGERSDREDLVMFINACFAATRQSDYYRTAAQQSVSILFLHKYIQNNYRRLYARALAAGINHFNQSMIIGNLLASGAPEDPAQRSEEGELIFCSLRALPANRAYALIRQLSRRKVNNRRTRAVIKRFLKNRRELPFDAVKYGKKLRAALRHSHLNLPGEVSEFLFTPNRKKRYETELLQNYHVAKYSASAVYTLPFSIAESLIHRHNIPRDVFLKKIEPKMTAAERLRQQASAQKASSSQSRNYQLEIDLARAPLTKLLLYVLSMTYDERRLRADELELAICASAKRTLARSPLRLGRTAAILDHSRSSVGSRTKRHRPLAVSIGASYLLREASTEYRAFWAPIASSTYAKREFQRTAFGQTSLADGVIDALEWKPDLIVIVSDGFENDPPGATNQIVKLYQQRIGKPNAPEIIHANPVFDAYHFSPRTLGDTIATVGLRDAEDLPTMLGFARFAGGRASLAELETYLLHRAETMLKNR